MAQVYRFTDENGVVRLFAEISPDPAFNGGAITAPVTIASAAQPQLTVSGVGATGEISLDDDLGTTSLDLTSGGNVIASGGQIVLNNAANTATLAGLLSQGIYLAVHSAPADGDLGAGDLYLWFDQTNGAAKLMVKAKQADGTVKTAAVALS